MTAAAPRGFTFDRNDGRAVLPGNLHTNRQLAQWLDFSQPGRVRVFTGKVELGQGILTALSIIAADELDVDLDQVHIVSASTLEGPDEGMTSSSISVQDSGSAIRHACAEVRFLALQQAARHHGLPADALRVEQGQLHGRPRSRAGGLLGSAQGHQPASGIPGFGSAQACECAQAARSWQSPPH
jgi:CO/xanthine dehydrogenase Mo-binding subunit